MSFWDSSTLGQHYMVLGLAFFMLGMVASMLPKYNMTWHFAPHLSLLAAFSILYGMVEFVEMQRLNNPAEWLTRLDSLLLLASYLPLLEFARCTWNSTSGSVRLPAPWVYGAASIVVAALTLQAPEPIAELVASTRFFVGALTALLTGLALFATLRAVEKAITTIHNEVCLGIIVLAFICYSLSTFFLFRNDPHVPIWLPTQADFLVLFGFPVQLLRAVCAVAGTMGLVSLVLLAGKYSPIEATAFRLSQEAIVITDANNVILRVNNAFTESTGYTALEAVDHNISLLQSGRHDDAFYAALRESINRTGTWQGEIWDRRKNGEIYPKLLTLTAVKNAAGVVIYYVGTHINISERKAAGGQI